MTIDSTILRRTAITFAAAIAVAVLPTLTTLLLLGRAGGRQLRCGADAEPSEGVFQVAASSRSTTSRAPSVAASSAADHVRGKLHAARASAVERRLRVSFAMFQAGWALSVISLTPLVMLRVDLPIEAAVGSHYWWLVLLPLGKCLLALALFPTDARAIRVVCALLLVQFSFVGALIIADVLAGPDAQQSSLAVLYLAAASALPRTLICCGDCEMQPRPALRWLWTVVRLFFLGRGVIFVGFSIATKVQGGNYFDWKSAALSVACLACAALATPHNRGRIHRRLGRLGGRGTEAEKAAAVAALVGGSDPDAALERASKLLRCLPASRLLASDLAGDMTTAPPEGGATLHARTEPAAMGEVTAFLSHSWSDEKEAPGAKHALISRWAKRREEMTGNEPTLWLVPTHSH